MSGGKCTFDRAWCGPCNRPVENGDRFCAEHASMKCVSCKAQATHDCDHAGQFVCGAPLCADCTGWFDLSKPSGAWGFMNHRHASKQWLKQREREA